MKPHRFFFHYNKAKKAMTIHWRGACHIVQHLKCQVPVESKWNKRQPRLVMQGFAHEINFAGGFAQIL